MATRLCMAVILNIFFFFVVVQISMQTRWARKVSSCIGATSWQLFLDRRYIQVRGGCCISMTVLCALTVARATAAALQGKCKNKASALHDMTDALENLKEVLAQVHINETYVEHLSMTKFCDQVLWSTRGLLLQWDVTTTSLQELPAQKMPLLEKNRVWSIKHPDRERYLSEVSAGVNFLLAQQEILKGEPWEWLFHFVHQLEYALL